MGRGGTVHFKECIEINFSRSFMQLVLPTEPVPKIRTPNSALRMGSIMAIALSVGFAWFCIVFLAAGFDNWMRCCRELPLFARRRQVKFGHRSHRCVDCSRSTTNISSIGSFSSFEDHSGEHFNRACMSSGLLLNHLY